jgi:hypothetical protein
VLRQKELRAAEVAAAKAARAEDRARKALQRGHSQAHVGARPTETEQGSPAEGNFFGLPGGTPLPHGHRGTEDQGLNFSSPPSHLSSPQYFFTSPTPVLPVPQQQQFHFHQIGTPVLSTQTSHPPQSVHLPQFPTFPMSSIPMQQCGQWTPPSDVQLGGGRRASNGASH